MSTTLSGVTIKTANGKSGIHGAKHSDWLGPTIRDADHALRAIKPTLRSVSMCAAGVARTAPKGVSEPRTHRSFSY
jgi:hypothetical protein